MTPTLRLLGTTFLLSVLLLCTTHVALAGVGVRGHIRIWNPLTDQYEPLAKARVRVVLGEYSDSDTFDVEDTADRDGYYEITKGEPWFRDAYDAYIIVFAESPWKLEVQEYSSQIDGYQAESKKVTAPDGEFTDIDLTLGGTEDDVDEWQLGGLADLDNSSPTYSRRGWRAFFIYHEMTDHRLFLLDGALGAGNFEEKEVSFPHSEDPVRERVLDYIKIPDRVFPEHYTTQSALNKLLRASHTFRHELSHGVMADEYWIMPDSAGDHSYWQPCDHYEGAWVEAWADFLAHASLTPRYKNRKMLDPTASVPYMNCEVSPEVEMPGGSTASVNDLIEGYIANVLWDIHDGEGWEKRRIQRTDIPGDELFWDGISDPDLAKIWDVFTDERPYAFSHDHSSFVRVWLDRADMDMRHALKSILYNQGMSDLRLHEGPALVELGDITWDGWQAQIPITVLEQDEEDKPHVRANIFLNERLVQRVTLGEGGWENHRKTITVGQDVAWAPGLPNPRFLIESDDNMMSDVAEDAPEPPPEAQMGGVIAELLEVNVSREADPPLDSSYWFTGMPELSQIFCNVTVTDGTNTSPRRTQMADTTWRTKADTYAFAETTELYKLPRLPEYVELSFNVGGWQSLEVGGGGRVDLNSQPAPIRWTRDEAYGFAPQRVEIVLDEIVTVKDTLGNPVQLHTTFEVVYRLRPYMPAQPRTLPERGMISETLRGAQGQPTRGDPYAGVDLTTTPPIPALETLSLSAALSRSSSLAEEYTRIQGQALAIADELEARLDPDRRPQAEAGGGDTGLRTTIAMPSLMMANGVLQAPQQTTFLNNASTGKLRIPVLSAEQMEYLRELRQEVVDREARLPEIEGQRTQLVGFLSNAMQGLGDVEELRPLQRRSIREIMRDAKTRLQALATTMGDYQSILGQERETIDFALTAPGAEEPTTPTVRDPRDPPGEPAEDDGQVRSAAGWLLTGGADVAQDGTGTVLAFAGPGRAMSENEEHHSLKLSFEYRHTDSTGEVGFCLNEEGRGLTAYLVRLTGNRIAVRRAEGGLKTTLGAAKVSLAAGQWHQIQVDLKRGQFSISVDDRDVLEARDELAYLRGGHLTFACLSGDGLACREVRTTRW